MSPETKDMIQSAYFKHGGYKIIEKCMEVQPKLSKEEVEREIVRIEDVLQEMN